MKEIFELLLVHFPFIDGETEAQRGLMACLQGHGCISAVFSSGQG